MTLEEYHEWLVDIRGVNLGSLEAASPDDDGRSLLKYISDDEENWPSRLLERSELQRLLADAIEKMPRTERIVISLYYHEELTLREISKVVNLHESRVSQLKSQAILRLRTYMEKRWPMERRIGVADKGHRGVRLAVRGTGASVDARHGGHDGRSAVCHLCRAPTLGRRARSGRPGAAVVGTGLQPFGKLAGLDRSRRAYLGRDRKPGPQKRRRGGSEPRGYSEHIS